MTTPQLAPCRAGWQSIREADRQVLSHSAFAQLVVDRYLRTQPWRTQLKAFREIHRERRDAMLDALENPMPTGLSWTRPDGGFFVWLTSPDGLDSKTMLPRAVQFRSGWRGCQDGLGNQPEIPDHWIRVVLAADQDDLAGGSAFDRDGDEVGTQ